MNKEKALHIEEKLIGKVEVLKKFGYKCLNDDLLKDIKSRDERLYKKINKVMENLEKQNLKPLLVIFFKKNNNTSFSIYSSKFLEKDIDEIIEGTRRLLRDLNIKPNETDFELIEK